MGLLAAGAATAATSPEVIAPPAAEARTSDVAVNGAGRAAAVWTGTAGNGFAVYGRVRLSRTGAWGPVGRLSAVVAERPLAPTVVVGTRGGAVAVWRIQGGAVESATLPAGSTSAWTRRTVATDGEGFVAPAISAVPTIAVWADRQGATWRARRAHLLDRSWRLSSPLDLSDAGLIPPGAPDSPPDLAVGARGDAAVIWPGPSGPPVPAAATRLSVALWPRGSQAWQPAITLSEHGAHGDVALSPAGHAGAAWVEAGTSVLASVRDPDAAVWPAPDTLVAGQTATPAFPHIAINHEGYAVAGWGETEGDLSLRARTRSGASGIWGPERTVFDDFQFFSVLELANLEAVVDDDRVATLAWMDPEGPGSASAYAARATSGAWSIAAHVAILEDIDDAALAADARGGALLVTPRARLIDEPHIDLVAAEFPAPARFRLSADQVRVNQRISQAAVRRANAVMARLRDGFRSQDIRNGTLDASKFGDGVRVEGTPTGEVVPAGPIAPLDIAPPGQGGPVTLSAAQLRINQRISQAAVVRAGFARNTLSLGLTGQHVADGAVRAEKLLPGLRITQAVPVTTPLPPSPVFRPGTSGSGRVTLSVEQLKINQRIAQAAVLRANWLVERLDSGIRGEDVRAGGLRAEDLAPALPTG